MDIARIGSTPDSVLAVVDGQARTLSADGNGQWSTRSVRVVAGQDAARPHEGRMPVRITAEEGRLGCVVLRWNTPLPDRTRILGDHWERAYGDLEWRGIVPERVMPWYALVHHDGTTHGVGVQTGAGAMCFWQIDQSGVTLTIDTRCGALGVELAGRTLEACTVRVREGLAGESTHDAARALCALLCEHPRIPAVPVYGANDWYYAYGTSTRQRAIEDAERVSSWSPSANRPFMVLDDGWQPDREGGHNGGPWTGGNDRFGDMATLADQITERGAKPGLWFRPLVARPTVPESWRLPAGRRGQAGQSAYLDPSVEGVLDQVREDIGRFVSWGYQLIKHDWSTHDCLALWGFEMGSRITEGEWSFADRSRTTAEIIVGFYRAIREAAGDTIVIGCNTIGHLAAGLVELQRTGDDTSGREWERTRKMGINTLAFRMCQQGTFFLHDADCVGLTEHVSWDLNRQWLDVLARSGTPLFVSADPRALGADQEAALREALTIAAEPRTHSIALDWMDTTCPRRWRSADGEREYDWMAATGAAVLPAGQ